VGTSGYNTAMNACAFSGLWQLVLALLEEMNLKKLPKSVSTYGHLEETLVN